MSGKRARAIRQQVYGHHLHSFRPEARTTRTIYKLITGGTVHVTDDERRRSYQQAKQDRKQRGKPGPSPARRQGRPNRIPYWDAKARRKQAWQKKAN